MPAELRLTVQRATRLRDLPNDTQVRKWVRAALTAARYQRTAELTVRLVNAAEGRRLNRRWRGKDYATNVLSFPAEMPGGLGASLLGDLVICAPVVRREAGEQGKSPEAHWAHLVVHGSLHLLGYDHVVRREARQMESLEIAVLGKCGFSNPYIV